MCAYNTKYYNEMWRIYYPGLYAGVRIFKDKYGGDKFQNKSIEDKYNDFVEILKEAFPNFIREDDGLFSFIKDKFKPIFPIALNSNIEGYFTDK